MPLKTSARLLRSAFSTAMWELFAGMAAVLTLPVAYSFLFYPGVLHKSPGYHQLEKMFSIPQPLGVVALAASLMVLGGLGSILGRWGLLILTLFWILLTSASVASVGVSGGTVWFFLFFSLALFGFLRSGGVERPHPARSP